MEQKCYSFDTASDKRTRAVEVLPLTLVLHQHCKNTWRLGYYFTILSLSDKQLACPSRNQGWYGLRCGEPALAFFTLASIAKRSMTTIPRYRAWSDKMLPTSIMTRASSHQTSRHGEARNDRAYAQRRRSALRMSEGSVCCQTTGIHDGSRD
jgi:hypothetical protein